jgi:hypothetical protein
VAAVVVVVDPAVAVDVRRCRRPSAAP